MTTRCSHRENMPIKGAVDGHWRSSDAVHDYDYFLLSDNVNAFYLIKNTVNN